MPVSKEARRIPNKKVREHIGWVHTHRFIEEVHRIEAEGRVQSRSALEERLLLGYGSITSMRAGRLRVSTQEIELLKREFNGDFQYVLFGSRDFETSGNIRAGRSLVVKPGGYVFHYQTNSAVNLLTKAGLPTAAENE
jgi:hypothetical protein